eukprot:TRINITY_DN12368_c0_g1_i1.p1 TRINITY_DN12368_c0_g1~~TRINITY_DN12368_c0_g1_i1.p1  ORF type:complete len:562 (+),score=196.37 TRINITY_DN12368_c0_g1_i1:97-1782(+)
MCVAIVTMCGGPSEQSSATAICKWPDIPPPLPDVGCRSSHPLPTAEPLPTPTHTPRHRRGTRSGDRVACCVWLFPAPPHLLPLFFSFPLFGTMMRTAVCAAALLALGAAPSASASDVLVATTETFDAMVHDNDMVDVILVDFYAPWCGHCKSLEPELEKAAAELKDKAHIIKVDATVETSLASRYNVKSYPTLTAWIGGHEHHYDGARTAAGIIEWVSHFTGPPVAHLKTHDDLKNFKLEHYVFAVGFFEDGSSHAATAFETIATRYRHSFVFAAVYDAQIALEEGVKMPGLAVYKQFDDKLEVMEDGFHEEGMMDFLQAHSFPIFAEMKPKTFKQYYLRGLPMAWLFVNEEFVSATKEAKEAVSQVAETYRGKMSFVWLDGTQQHGLMTKVGLNATKLPSFAIDAGEHFPLSESVEVTREAVARHCEMFHSGKLEASYRSEAVPEHPERNGIRQLVGSNIKEVMNDDTRDVFIRFYSSNEESAATAAIFHAVAQEFEHESGVLLAEINGVENDVPLAVLPGGIPRYYLVTAHGNEVVQYRGPTTQAAMAEWLRHEAHTLK